MDTNTETHRKKPGRKPGRTHTVQLKVMLTPDAWAKFVGAVDWREVSYSEAAREAIAEWVERIAK